MARRALVLVFGDVCRSPRMQNHVRELAKAGWKVDFAGYLPNNQPCEELYTICNLLLIPDFVWLTRSLPTLVAMAVKLIVQTLWVLWMGLFRVSRPELVLVQTPPVLPTLLIAPLLAWWHGARYIVDWHNLGYTILAQNRRVPRVLIAFAKSVERLLTPLAEENLVVSAAMKEWLLANGWMHAERIHLLYDRPDPTHHNRPLTMGEREAFRRTLRQRLGWDPAEDVPIVMSSTSWTADEDFGLLLDALILLDRRIAERALLRHTCLTLPSSIQVVITGRGPLRAHYEEAFAKADLQHIHLATTWLSSADYYRLVGSADVGVCLHVSSSGIDLPIKLIDMLGCALPAAAVRFPAITEIVQHPQSGLLFDKADELALLLLTLLADYPRNAMLQEIREHLLHAHTNHTLLTFSEHWRKVATPLLPKPKSPSCLNACDHSKEEGEPELAREQGKVA